MEVCIVVDIAPRARVPEKNHKAAMKESLAVDLFLESGWDLLVNAAKEEVFPPSSLI